MDDRDRLKLLIFAFHFPPENTSGAARPARFARFLPEFGVDCTVVAQGEGSDRPGVCYVAEHGGAGWRAWAARKAQRWLLPLNERLPWVPAAADAASSLHAKVGFDAVLSTMPPVASHLAAMEFQRRTGIPWIVDFRDPLALNPTRRRRYFDYDLWLEKRIFARGNLFLANTDALMEHWRQRHPAAMPQVRLLWNGFDPDEAVGVPPPRREGPRTWTHVGVLYGVRLPDRPLQVMAHLLREGRWAPGDWKLKLVGQVQETVYRNCLDERAYLLERGALEASGHLVDRNTAMAEQAAADALLLLDNPGRGESIQVPAKLFDYVRTGQPVVAWTHEGSPTMRLLDRSGVRALCLTPATPVPEAAARVFEFLNGPLEPRPMAESFQAAHDGRRQAGFLAGEMRALIRARATPGATCPA